MGLGLAGVLTRHEASGEVSGLPSHEVAVIALATLGGGAHAVDTEDVAVRAADLAPGRFAWRRYPEQINLDLVRVALSDAKKPRKGELVVGSGRSGWSLTPAGARLAAMRLSQLALAFPHGDADRERHAFERRRMVESAAMRKARAGSDPPTDREIEDLFRVDAYIRGSQRRRRVSAVVAAHGDDPEIGSVVRRLAERIEPGGRE